MIYHDDQNPSCMHACKGMFVCGWLLTHKQLKVYKHADQYAHKYACVNTRTYIKPDDEAVITASLALRSKPCSYRRKISKMG